MKMSTALAIALLAAITASPGAYARKQKLPAPALDLPSAWYTWSFAGYGDIRVDVKVHESAAVSMLLTNSTPLKVLHAVVTFRRYRQPLSGVVAGSEDLSVSNIPHGQAGFNTFLSLSPGCALVFDSIYVRFENESGAVHEVRSNTNTDIATLFYPGPGCFEEQQKYNAAKAAAAHSTIPPALPEHPAVQGKQTDRTGRNFGQQ